MTSWDSSMHDSVHLNRITPNNERVYLIVKVVVRLSHPASMELVLRKRICINVYKRQSLTDKLKKRIGKSVTFTKMFALHLRSQKSNYKANQSVLVHGWYQRFFVLYIKDLILKHDSNQLTHRGFMAHLMLYVSFDNQALYCHKMPL